MPRHSKITRDLSAILETRHDIENPTDKELLDPDLPYWVPDLDVVIDNSTGADVLREGPVITIYADRVERVSTIRDKTTQEIDTAAGARVDGDKALKAVVIWAAGKLGEPVSTARAEIIAIYKAL